MEIASLVEVVVVVVLETEVRATDFIVCGCGFSPVVSFVGLENLGQNHACWGFLISSFCFCLLGSVNWSLVSNVILLFY